MRQALALLFVVPFGLFAQPPGYRYAILTRGPATADFTISSDASNKSVQQGSSTTFTLTQTAQNGYSAATNITASSTVAGVTGACSPSSVTGSGTCTLTVSASSGAATGNAPITVTATGSVTHTLTLSVNVTSSGTPSMTSGTNTGYYDPNTNYTADQLTSYSTSVVSVPVLWQALQASFGIAPGDPKDMPYVGANPVYWAPVSTYKPYSAAGDYNSGTTYQIGQCVNNAGRFGCALQTMVGHAPGSTSDAYWTITPGGVTPITATGGSAVSGSSLSASFKGYWDGRLSYSSPGFVLHGVQLYYALAPSHDVEPGSEGSQPTYWQAVVYPYNFRDAGNFNSSYTFTPNDCVHLLDSTYCANRYSQNSIPAYGASTSDWTVTSIGANTPTVLTSISPSAPVTIHAGETQQFTVTYQPAFGCSATVTPTLTGFPSGASVTFSPSTVANCNGSTTASVLFPATTTTGNYTLSFNGTVNGNDGFAPAFSAVTVSAPGFITLTGTQGTYGTTNLTSVGTRDWVVWTGSGFTRKAGGNTIQNLQSLDCADTNFYGQTGSPTLTWSDGPTGNVSGSSTGSSSLGSVQGHLCHFYFDLPYTKTDPISVFVFSGKAGNDGNVGYLTFAPSFTNGTANNPVQVFETNTFLNGGYAPYLYGIRLQGPNASGTIKVQLTIWGDVAQAALQAIAIQ